MSKEVEKIAHLARLHLTADQVESLGKKFDEVKGYFNELAALEINVDLDETGADLGDLREDKAIKYPITLSFSPYVEDNLFKVPKVIE